MTSKRTVYVEGTPLVRKNRTGVDYYALGLFSELIAKMPEVEFRLFYFADEFHNLEIKAKNIKKMPIEKISSRNFRLRHMLGIAPTLEKLLDEKHTELVLFTNFYAWPVATKSAKVFQFVYDTTYLDTPEYVAKKNRILLRRLVDKTIAQATKVITISEAAKKALIGHYGGKDDDYTVIYPAPKLSRTTQKVEKMPDSFLLFMGTLEPRKNVANLIKAHLSLDDRIREQYPLVLAGGKGWNDEEILALIEDNIGNQIYTIGYVTDAQKAWLYKNAYALVYPALFEGFGMPIVEAMAAGTPVVTCKNTSLPEAGGKAAIYCKDTVEGIAQGMLACIDDKARKHRIQEGQSWARKFSWAQSADKLKEIIEGVQN